MCAIYRGEQSVQHLHHQRTHQTQQTNKTTPAHTGFVPLIYSKQRHTNKTSITRIFTISYNVNISHGIRHHPWTSANYAKTPKGPDCAPSSPGGPHYNNRERQGCSIPSIVLQSHSLMSHTHSPLPPSQIQYQPHSPPVRFRPATMTCIMTGTMTGTMTSI